MCYVPISAATDSEGSERNTPSQPSPASAQPSPQDSSPQYSHWPRIVSYDKFTYAYVCSHVREIHVTMFSCNLSTMLHAKARQANRKVR